MSAFVPVEYVDLRKLEIGFDNFTPVQGDMLALPYESDSLESISCLHSAEHLYDRINPPEMGGGIFIRAIIKENNFMADITAGRALSYPTRKTGLHRIPAAIARAVVFHVRK